MITKKVDLSLSGKGINTQQVPGPVRILPVDVMTAPIRQIAADKITSWQKAIIFGNKVVSQAVRPVVPGRPRHGTVAHRTFMKGETETKYFF